MKFRLFVLSGVFLAFPACGQQTSTPGADSISSKAEQSSQNPLAQPAAAIFAISSKQELEIVLSDRADICSLLQNGEWGPNENTAYFMVVNNASNQTLAPAVGSYNITTGIDPNAGFSSGSEGKLDASCKSSVGSVFTAGAVMISAIDDAKVTGSYNVSGGNDTFQGNFTAVNCPGMNVKSSGCAAQ